MLEKWYPQKLAFECMDKYLPILTLKYIVLGTLNLAWMFLVDMIDDSRSNMSIINALNTTYVLTLTCILN